MTERHLKIMESYIAAPDTVRGETVVAIVTMRAGGTMGEDAIVESCRRRLGASQAPRAVEQWSDIPKPSLGKVDTLDIRAQPWKTGDLARGAAR